MRHPALSRWIGAGWRSLGFFRESGAIPERSIKASTAARLFSRRTRLQKRPIVELSFRPWISKSPRSGCIQIVMWPLSRAAKDFNFGFQIAMVTGAPRESISLSIDGAKVDEVLKQLCARYGFDVRGPENARNGEALTMTGSLPSVLARLLCNRNRVIVRFSDNASGVALGASRHAMSVENRIGSMSLAFPCCASFAVHQATT